MFKLGLAFLLFLPVIESFNRQPALILLFSASILISYPIFIKRKVHLDLINLTFLFFIVWGMFTTIFSISIIRSFTEIARYLAYFLIFITIRDRADYSNFYSKFFILFILLNSLLLSFLFIGFSVFSLKPPQTAGMNLFYPVFGHNRIANLLIFTIPLLMGLKLQFGNKKVKFLLNSGIIYFLLILIASFGRGSWWALSGAMIINIFLFPQISRKFKKLLVFFVITVFILTSAIFVYSHSIVSKREGAFVYTGLYKPLVNENRIDYFWQAIKGFTVSPIIGTGFDTFRYISKKYQSNPFSWSWYTHNHFLQLFSETGFTGGILFILLFLIIIRKFYQAIKNSTHKTYEQLIFMSLLPSILHTFIDYDWQFISILLLIFIGLALLVPQQGERIKIPGRFFWIIALVFFATAIALSYFDSDRAIAKSDLKLLERAERLDRGYNEIYKKKAEIYAEKKEYGLAHKNYIKAISLDPLDSGELIKTDFLLYLEEANEMKSFDIISKSINVYSYFHDKYGKGLLRRDNLTEYTQLMRKMVEENPIRIWEIKKIID